MSCNVFSRHLLQKNNKYMRYKHKITHWSMQKKKIFPIDKALNHFDDFYAQVFGKNWPSIRNGLLNKPKYVAVVNNYSDTERITSNLENIGAINVRKLFNLEKERIRENYEKNKRQRDLDIVWKMDAELEKKVENGKDNTECDNSEVKEANLSLDASLQNAEFDSSRIIDSRQGITSELLYQFVPATKIKGRSDWISESTHYSYYDINAKFTVQKEKQYDIHFPDYLNVYCYEHSNHTDFESPKKGSTEVLDYYLLDGGSLLPVLALDLKPGCRMLDMCAAPGGKSLLALQTLYPDYLLCNDISYSRVDRIYRVLRQYFYNLDEQWFKPNKIRVRHCDARQLEKDGFDRVLVDVPCTTDRLAVKENDNNIFKPSRIKERLKLPELQCELLVAGLKLVRRGGIVVYSTCSLSPIQNDGVVHMALKKLWEESRTEVVVKDLTPALLQAHCVYNIADPSLMKYGNLVVPYLPQNYGPTYFCKLQKV